MDLEAKKRELGKKAIDRWGGEDQCRQAQEELAELIVALSHAIRGRKHNVHEEIADVEIMLTQMRMVFGSALVDASLEIKLDRLEAKLG